MRGAPLDLARNHAPQGPPLIRIYSHMSTIGCGSLSYGAARANRGGTILAKGSVRSGGWGWGEERRANPLRPYIMTGCSAGDISPDEWGLRMVVLEMLYLTGLVHAW